MTHPLKKRTAAPMLLFIIAVCIIIGITVTLRVFRLGYDFDPHRTHDSFTVLDQSVMTANTLAVADSSRIPSLPVLISRLLYRTAGSGWNAARLGTVLFGIGIILLLLFLQQKKQNQPVFLGMLLLSGINILLIHYSRVPNIYLPVLFTVTLFFIIMYHSALTGFLGFTVLAGLTVGMIAPPALMYALCGAFILITGLTIVQSKKRLDIRFLLIQLFVFCCSVIAARILIYGLIFQPLTTGISIQPISYAQIALFFETGMHMTDATLLYIPLSIFFLVITIIRLKKIDILDGILAVWLVTGLFMPSGGIGKMTFLFAVLPMTLCSVRALFLLFEKDSKPFIAGIIILGIAALYYFGISRLDKGRWTALSVPLPLTFAGVIIPLFLFGFAAAFIFSYIERKDTQPKIKNALLRHFPIIVFIAAAMLILAFLNCAPYYKWIKDGSLRAPGMSYAGVRQTMWEAAAIINTDTSKTNAVVLSDLAPILAVEHDTIQPVLPRAYRIESISNAAIVPDYLFADVQQSYTDIYPWLSDAMLTPLHDWTLYEDGVRGQRKYRLYRITTR